MRLIDADALELEGWYLSRNYRVDSRTMCFETKDIKKVPTAQPENARINARKTHACDCISRQAAIDGFYEMASDIDHLCTVGNYVHFLETMTSAQAQPKWNNHTVACLLAELFDDTCACNYNGIDEWLPEKCELLDSCPNPGGVACWEQFLKHKAERITDE